jgi:CRP-like cAMP-binding protein
MSRRPEEPLVAGAAILRQVPLFAELSDEELGSLGTALRRRRFARGEVIFLAGDPGDALYVIESGRVKIVLSSPDGKEVVLALLGPTEFFGDLALLDGEPRSADAITAEDTTTALLSRTDFLRFVEARPSVASRLLAILSRRLRRNAQIIQDASFAGVAARLARVLVELATPSGDGRLVIRQRLTQGDLAAMVGASRESVNKTLRAWEQEGLVERQPDQALVLRDPQRLTRV